MRRAHGAASRICSDPVGPTSRRGRSCSPARAIPFGKSSDRARLGRPAVFGTRHRTRPARSTQIARRERRSCSAGGRTDTRTEIIRTFRDGKITRLHPSTAIFPERWHRMSRLDNVRQPVNGSDRQESVRRELEGNVMSTIATRAASGVAVLALAFATVAGTGLPAAADAARPATPISVLPQGGFSARSVDALTIGAAQVGAASVSPDKVTKKKKKKVQGRQGPGLREAPARGPLPLRRHRTQRLGLLGADQGCLEARRQEDPADLTGTVARRQEGGEVQAPQG